MVAARLEQLIGIGDDRAAAAGGGERFLYELKSDPGVLGTETFRKEVAKLEWVKALGLPRDLFEAGHGCCARRSSAIAATRRRDFRSGGGRGSGPSSFAVASRMEVRSGESAITSSCTTRPWRSTVSR